MTEPTDADREKAVGLLRDAAADQLIHSTEYRHQGEMIARVAAALAEARAAGRAEEALAVADAWQWGAWFDLPGHDIGAAQHVTEWLRARANALTGERAQR